MERIDGMSKMKEDVLCGTEGKKKFSASGLWTNSFRSAIW